jgi:hypothetical protein
MEGAGDGRPWCQQENGAAACIVVFLRDVSPGEQLVDARAEAPREIPDKPAPARRGRARLLPFALHMKAPAPHSTRYRFDDYAVASTGRL